MEDNEKGLGQKMSKMTEVATRKFFVKYDKKVADLNRLKTYQLSSTFCKNIRF